MMTNVSTLNLSSLSALTCPAALVPGVDAATVVPDDVDDSVVVVVVVVLSQLLAQAPLQQVRPVSQRPF